MRALVTGGAGFIGSTLVDALLADGARVTVIDDLSRGRRELVPDAAELHVLDVTDAGVADVIAAAEADVIFHLAAQIDVRRSVADPLLDARINVLGTVNVLAAAVQAGVRRVVFASSGGAVYGDAAPLPTPETQQCRPASGYGAAKLAGESYGNVFAQVHGLEFVALRFANVYGPRQDPHGEAGVVAIFAERLLDGGAAVINGDGAQTRDYVHVDDVVAATMRAAETGNLGAYNIGTGHECDVNRLYALIAAAAGVNTRAQHGPGKAGEQRRSWLDVSRAAELLGWQPSIALEEGLSSTVGWFAGRRAQGIAR